MTVFQSEPPQLFDQFEDESHIDEPCARRLEEGERVYVFEGECQDEEEQGTFGTFEDGKRRAELHGDKPSILDPAGKPGKIFQLKFEDYSQEERVKMLLEDPDSYMALLTDEHYYLLYDGLAKIRPYLSDGVKNSVDDKR